MKHLFILAITLFSLHAGAWGKRGHETVGSLAAQLLGTEVTDARFLINHSFDMGYYNNAPDLVWKSEEATYKKEFSQHFMDMEAFQRAFKAAGREQTFKDDRRIFFKDYPKIENHEGRAFWRVKELYEKLEQVTTQLKKKQKDVKAQHVLQGEWLTTAGVMGHYIADLAQPLHVTENYDGEMTGQKGLHHWFEEDVIDALYPTLQNEVYQRAKSRWAEYSKTNKAKSPFELAQDLAKNSAEKIPELLALDKKVGRKNVSQVATDYKELATERLTQGVLTLALIWSKQVGWSYDGKRFYIFNSAPKYIDPLPEK